ncbi:MAG: EI24 domain-containing protein [Gammaproteobacteria bacterium]|nr:EI24 domain-containing protein [Gammaproteobacteria bacterium]
MSDIFQAFVRALRDLLHWRIVWLLLWPLGVSLLFWSVLALAYADDFVLWLSGSMLDSPLGRLLSQWLPLTSIAVGLGWLLIPALLVPLVLITTSLIVGFAVMPALIAQVAPKRYPHLERRRGGTLAGSVWNALIAIVISTILAVVTLPLWLLPPLWPMLAALLLGYLNARLFRYDAVAEHASTAEMTELFHRHRWSWFWLGALVSLFSYLPFVGLLVPLVAGLAFIHFGLARLAVLREGAPSAQRPATGAAR